MPEKADDESDQLEKMDMICEALWRMQTECLPSVVLPIPHTYLFIQYCTVCSLFLFL